MNLVPGNAAAPTRDDDLSLARRVAAGDRASFVVLMRHHNRRLYRLARATLRSEVDAEDALQEAYLCAYRAIGQFRGEASLSTWLTRMVLNECLQRLRRSARRDNIVPIVPMEDFDAMDAHDQNPPDQALARAELRQLLERSIDALPMDFRTVFVLRSVEELSVEETADCLGIAEATVRTRHFRARSLLRETLASALDLAERDSFDFGGVHCDRIVAAVLGRLGPPIAA
jgi:RNA polymerase sigma-70 factor (ECF subfamily)